VASPSIPQDVGYATVAATRPARVRLGLVADTHIPEAYSGSPSRVGTCALTILRLTPNGRRQVCVEQLKVT